MEWEVVVPQGSKNIIIKWDRGLVCNDDTFLSDLRQLMKLHLPRVVTLPDGIDYNDDTTDGANVFHAVQSIYPKAKVVKAPTDVFMGFDPNVIY